MYIYKLTNNLTGKCYIGQTRRTIEQRMYEHRQDARNGTGFYISGAIAKYGWSNFNVEVLAETDDVDELNRLERFYVQKYNADVKGYNLAPGGDSNAMDSLKVKEHHDTVMRSPEVRAKISTTLKRQIRESGRSAEYTSNMRKGFEAYLKSPKRLEDVAKQHLSPEHYRALNDAKNKAVYCIDVDGNVVAEFKRVKDAAEWWFPIYATVKTPGDLMNRIKESAKNNRYIKGLKWIYRV